MISWYSIKKASQRPYLYLGTTNPGKIREMSALLSSLGVEPRTMDSLPDVEETGRSYRANALLKAKAAALRGIPVLSEDSGLSVRALNGAPGLHSGRYSGNANHNSADNAAKLLEALKGIKDRRAAFVTAAAIADGGNTITATRRKPGLITDTPRGDKGFSYDTVFVPEGSNQTYAESGDKSDSSRDRAVRAVVEKYLNKQAAEGVSLQFIPSNLIHPSVPVWKKDDEELLRRAITLAGESDPTWGDEMVDTELTAAAMRNYPYRILKDGKTVGAAITGRFSHYDPVAKKNYSGQSLNDLAIFPEYQNQGIGKEAIKQLIKQMLQHDPKWLHIAHANNNERAAHLYRELGFSRPMKWGDNATSLHMKAKEAKKFLKEWNAKKAADIVDPDEGFIDNNRRMNPVPSPDAWQGNGDMAGWFDPTPVSPKNPLRPTQVYDPAIPTRKSPQYTGPFGFLRQRISRGPGTTSYDTSRYKAGAPGDYAIVFGGAGTGTGGVSENSMDPDSFYGKGNYAAFTWRQIPEALKYVRSLPKGSRLHVFGHSMGGTAAIDFAKAAKGYGIDIAGMDLRDAVRIRDRVKTLAEKAVGEPPKASIPGNVARATHRYNPGWFNNLNPFGRHFSHSDIVSMLGQRWYDINGASNFPTPKGMDHKQIGNNYGDTQAFPVHPGWRRDSGRSSLWKAMQGLK